MPERIKAADDFKAIRAGMDKLRRERIHSAPEAVASVKAQTCFHCGADRSNGNTHPHQCSGACDGFL